VPTFAGKGKEIKNVYTVLSIVLRNESRFQLFKKGILLLWKLPWRGIIDKW
jgi:hypothetical protein